MNFRGVGQLAKNEEQKDGGLGGPVDAKPSKRKRDTARDASVGAALRSVYSQTVDESVPSEFMDLLSKLD
jgi:hypothetical protein